MGDVKWSTDGENYRGAVDLRCSDGKVVTLSASIPRALVYSIAHRIRERLLTTAPEDVDVGAWGNLYDQTRFGKLAKYVAETQLKARLGEQIKRNGIVNATEWFGPWSLQTADRAYDLIIAAGEGDDVARGQLDAIRDAALAGDAAARRALAMFNAVALAVAEGLPAPSELAAAPRFDAITWNEVEYGAVRRAPVAARPVLRRAPVVPRPTYVAPRPVTTATRPTGVMPQAVRIPTSAAPFVTAPAPAPSVPFTPTYTRPTTSTYRPAAAPVARAAVEVQPIIPFVPTPTVPTVPYGWQGQFQGMPQPGGADPSGFGLPDQDWDEGSRGDVQFPDEDDVNDMAEYPEEVAQSKQENDDDGGGEVGGGPSADGGPETFPDEGGGGGGGIFGGAP